MKEHLQRIHKLCQVLEDFGYRPYQIKDIYLDCIGRSNLDSLLEEEAIAVATCLEEYISFAQKCSQTHSRRDLR